MKNLFSSPVRTFIYVTAIFGTAFAILIPPFQSPDEFTHFTRAYEVSNLKKSHRYSQQGKDLAGSYLPKSIKATYDKTRLYRYMNYPDVPQAKKYFLNQTKTSLKISLEKNNTIFYDTAASPAYVPFLYVPQAIGIKLLETAGAPVLIMLYATRFICLAIWILLGAYALNRIKTKNYRLALSGLLMLPMLISQAAVPGTDALLTGVTLLFFVEIYRLYRNGRSLNLKYYTYLTGLLLVMVAAKPVYLAFGALLLPLNLLRNRVGNTLAVSVGPALVGILYVAWAVLTKYPGGHIYVNSIDAAHAVPEAQLHYLIPNILNFVGPLFNTLFLGWGDPAIVSLGGVFGRLDTPLPMVFILLSFLLMFFAVFVGTKERTSTVSKRKLFLVLAVSALYVVGVLLSMYIISTPPQAKIITGVQGRYFLPIVLLFAIYTPKALVANAKTLNRFYCVVPVLLLAMSILVVWLRYYTFYPS